MCLQGLPTLSTGKIKRQRRQQKGLKNEGDNMSYSIQSKRRKRTRKRLCMEPSTIMLYTTMSLSLILTEFTTCSAETLLSTPPALDAGLKTIGKQFHDYHHNLSTSLRKKTASMKWMDDFDKFSKPASYSSSSGFMPPSSLDQEHIQHIRGGSTTTTTTTTSVKKKTTKKRKSRSNNTGFYYGLQEDLFLSPYSKKSASRSSTPPPPSFKQKLMASMPKPPPPAAISSSESLADVMGEALVELKEMREEIAALRDEMKYMKRRVREQRGTLDDEEEEEQEYSRHLRAETQLEDEDDELAHPPHGHGVGSIVSNLKRKREFDKIGAEVEEWAHRLLFEEEGEEDGWKEVKCNKFVRQKFNPDGTTTCFMKWLPDQRGKHSTGTHAKKPNRLFPCIKCYATINAPFEDVCAFLSDSNQMPKYNELVIDHRDLEEVTPHSKICWSQCPQILFIKSRDFVTFCHLKWKRDGTQVVVNQACEHEDAPGVHEEKDGHMCRAFALRGANFIQKDPDNPEKTRFAILAHADPGGGLPDWAMKTAVNAVAPIEPFKLFHNINSKIVAAGPAPPRAEMVSSMPGRSSRPGGLSQLGYACFWPHGGGLKEGFLHHEHHHHHHDGPHHHDEHDGHGHGGMHSDGDLMHDKQHEDSM